MKQQIVAFVFARGGSKGLARKNVRLLAGKPMVAHAIDVAHASAYCNRVIVSTDDLEIAQIARESGAEVPFMRPPELARDDAPEWLAWQHAVRSVWNTVASDTPADDVFVCIPPTAPLRTVHDVDACIERLLAREADVVLCVTPSSRSPYFNMVTLSEDGTARLVLPPAQPLHRRQDVPQVFDMTTIAYAARPAFVQTASSLFDGKVGTVIVPRERALDIDSEHDFRVAEILVKEKM